MRSVLASKTLNITNGIERLKVKSSTGTMIPHQYIDRTTGRICTEDLIADHTVQMLYGPAREKAPWLFKAVTSARASQVLGYMHFDLPAKRRPQAVDRMIDTLGIDMDECVAPAHARSNARALFERQIRYWDCRPMPVGAHKVVAPADSRVIVGHHRDTGDLFIKEKFFSYEEMLGPWQAHWLRAFDGGHVAVFRLTPDKYHYNHSPVTGRVLDIYTVEGGFHSCNPAAVVAAATPYSKNRRVVTVIDTDIPGGTGVGLVAMVEVVALMIGEIVQCYSDDRYAAPRNVSPGMVMSKGQPKSLFRPGSSVVVLFFQKDHIFFDADLLANSQRQNVQSRFTAGFQQPLVETDVQVRASIGTAL